jgi:hypothetical protein
MRFLIDSMFPPGVVGNLTAAGHDAASPADLGAHNLPDDVLIELATDQNWVIVTENVSDFAQVTTCSVILVRKSWWPQPAVGLRLAVALDRWARANPEPGPWANWLEAELR